MADNVPVAIARGVMGGARAAPKNFSKEFPELMEIFKSQTSPKQRALMRNEAQALFESALASPNTIVKLPNGAIVQIPAGRAIPPNAQILNKNPDDLRAIFPDEIRPYIPKTTSVPSGGSRPIPPAAAPPPAGPFGPRPAPAAPSPRLPNPITMTGLGAAGIAGGQTFDQAYPGQMERMTNELKEYLKEQGAQSTAGALALAEARKNQRPMSEVSSREQLDDSKFYERPINTSFEAPQGPRSDPTRLKGRVVGDVYGSFPSPEGDQSYYRSSNATFFPQTHNAGQNYQMPELPRNLALEQKQILQNLPMYRGPAVDEVRSPPEPLPYSDADDDRAMAFRERLGSVGPAGSLPMMARRGGGEGQYTAVIDPSILMLARERLMPYSMRGAEGRVSSESAPAASSARTGAAGPRAASSTSAESRPAGGLFSFKDPYEGMSSSRLMQLASERPDDPAMYFRADAALRRERPEMFEKKSEGGMARGGSAGSGKGGKDAAVMKALEIIHHMLSNR
jgi:hypothetical protein